MWEFCVWRQAERTQCSGFIWELPHHGHHVLCPEKPPPPDKKEKAQLKELNHPLLGEEHMCSVRKFGKKFFQDHFVPRVKGLVTEWRADQVG